MLSSRGQLAPPPSITHTGTPGTLHTYTVSLHPPILTAVVGLRVAAHDVVDRRRVDETPWTGRARWWVKTLWSFFGSPLWFTLWSNAVRNGGGVNWGKQSLGAGCSNGRSDQSKLKKRHCLQSQRPTCVSLCFPQLTAPLRTALTQPRLVESAPGFKMSTGWKRN